jgi:tetratricopeptide (TPR) repeat protein
LKKISLHQLQKALGKVNILFSRGNIEASEKILTELVSSFPSHPEVLSKLGTIYLYQDKLNDGIQVIKKSIEVNPYQPDVLNNYAVALLNSDRAKEAIEVINKAIKLKPDYIDAYYHQGIIFKSLGLLDEALEAYQNALKFSPTHENAILNSAALYIQLEKYNEAILFLNNFQLSIRSQGYFYNLGLAHLKIKNFVEAQQFFNSALSLNPNYYEALNNLGLSLEGMGRYEEALQAIDKALALDNQNIETYNNKGLILIELEKFEEAISQFQIAIKIKSDDFKSYNNLGVAFKGLGLLEEALKNYNLALGLKPDYAEAMSNRGLIFQELRNFDNALRDFNQAIKIKSNFAGAYVNRGLLFKNQHLYEQAFQDIKYASDLDPSNLDVNSNLSMIYLLVQLNFKDGWQSFERRKEVYEFKEKTRPLNKIYLDRLPGSDDPILICNEQGIGDQIIYLSLLHELEILPNKIYIKIDARLLPLFQRSFPKFIFLSNKESLDSNHYKYHMLCGSLPHIYRNSKDSFLNQRGSFLIADQSRTASLRKTLTSTHKYVCGIAWKSVNPKFGHFKSMALKNLLPILNLPFINFINLQYGDISKEIDLFNNEHGTNINKIDEIDNFNDIDGLASLIDACDFIVTISNVTAHIAGALGKKVFLLVPYEQGRLWYWHENLTKSLWYPSVQIFSQNETGDWSVPINQIKQKIVKDIAHD